MSEIWCSCGFQSVGGGQWSWLLSHQRGSKWRLHDKPVITAVTVIHDTLLCVLVQEETVAQCGQWAVEGDISYGMLRAICRRCTHRKDGSMYRRGAEINHGFWRSSQEQYPTCRGNAHTLIHLDRCWSTGRKISYFTTASQSSRNSEMGFVCELRRIFADHQPACGLFAHHTVHSTTQSA